MHIFFDESIVLTKVSAVIKIGKDILRQADKLNVEAFVFSPEFFGTEHAIQFSKQVPEDEGLGN